MSAQPNVKRPKVKETRISESNEYFPDVPKIEYYNYVDNINNDLLYYRYFNASEKINGHNMEEWLRFVINFDNIFDQNRECSVHFQQWNKDWYTVDSYKRRIRAFFEMILKLGIKRWTVSFKNLIPPADTLDESYHNLDEITDYIHELHQNTGIQLVYLSISFPFLENDGKSPCNDPLLFSYYGQQMKKCMDIAYKLNSDGLLINSPNESDSVFLMADIQRELKNYIKMLKMVYDYKEHISFRGDLVLGSYDVKSNSKFNMAEHSMNLFNMLCILKQFSLDKHFKLKIHSPYEYGMVTSLNTSVGAIELPNLYTPTVEKCASIMKHILENGLMHSPAIILNGLNLNSVQNKSVFEHFITNIDIYAMAMRIICKIYSEEILSKNMQIYQSPNVSFPNSLRECDEHVRKNMSTIHKLPHRAYRTYWSTMIAGMKHVI